MTAAAARSIRRFECLLCRYGISGGVPNTGLHTDGTAPLGFTVPEKPTLCAKKEIISPGLPTVSGVTPPVGAPELLQNDSPPPPAAPAAWIPTSEKHATMAAMRRMRIFFMVASLSAEERRGETEVPKGFPRLPTGNRW
jgi:hypothetical protein